jgi:hypothetical protein
MMDLIMVVNQIFARVSCLGLHVGREWSFQNGTWWAVECLHDMTLVSAK